MSNKTRLFSIVLGAAALAGLTYGVTRRGLQRRTVSPLTSQTLTGNATSAPLPAPASILTALDWETLGVQAARDSTPDPLEIALDLDWIFDGQSEDGHAVTVRPDIRLPPPHGADDEEASSADDLGLAWLMHATQTEQGLTESDLTPELENIAVADDSVSEEVSEEDESVGQDEHEDFQRTQV